LLSTVARPIKVLLEHHAGAAAMRSHGAAATQLANAFDDHATGCRFDETVERPQQSRFASTRCAEENCELAPFEVNSRWRKRTRPGGIDDFEVFDLDHVWGTN
jgi:hypothetical protein